MWFAVGYCAFAEQIRDLLTWILFLTKVFPPTPRCCFFPSHFPNRTLSAWACRHGQDPQVWWSSEVHYNTEQVVSLSRHLLSVQSPMEGISCRRITSITLWACLLWAADAFPRHCLQSVHQAQALAPHIPQGVWGPNTVPNGRKRMDCFLQAGHAFI